MAAISNVRFSNKSTEKKLRKTSDKPNVFNTPKHNSDSRKKFDLAKKQKRNSNTSDKKVDINIFNAGAVNVDKSISNIVKRNLIPDTKPIGDISDLNKLLSLNNTRENIKKEIGGFTNNNLDGSTGFSSTSNSLVGDKPIDIKAVDLKSDQFAKNFLGLTLKFSENILNNFDQIAYHFRFFITPDIGIFSQTVKPIDVNKVPQITIAESGISEFNIRDVEIEGVISPSKIFQNTTATKFTINIAEPAGISFIEKMFAAGQELGVGNYTKAPFHLELSFLGYDSKSTDGSPKKIEGLSWIWRIAISNLVTKTAAGGSTYVITAVPFSDIGKFNTNLMLTSIVNVSASNVGDFFKEIEFILNKQDLEKTLFGNSPITRYKVIIEENNELLQNIQSTSISSWKLQSKKTDVSSQRMMSIKGNSTIKTISIPNGTTFNSIVDYIFANTEEGPMSVAGTKTSDSTEQRKKRMFAFIPIVKTQVKYTNFDIDSNDYNKEVTFRIILHKKTGVIIDDKQIKNDYIDVSKQKLKIFKLNKAGVFTKTYDYIFTGLNTEVIKFDIDYNFLWFAMLGLFRGRGSIGKATVGPKYNAESRKIFKNTKSIKKVLQAQREIVGKFDIVSNPTLNKEEKQLISILAAKNRRNIDAANKLNRTKRKNIPKRSFAEDSKINLAALGQNQLVPLSIAQTSSDPAVNVSGLVEANFSQSRSLYGAALRQLYTGGGPGFTPDLMKINMTIKGDPYWLGLTEIEIEEMIFKNNSSTKQDETIQLNRPDFNSSTPLFLLTFGAPSKISEKTGLAELKKEQVFSGVYRAVRVISKFKDGKFTQELEAVRDTEINWGVIATQNDQNQRVGSI